MHIDNYKCSEDHSALEKMAKNCDSPTDVGEAAVLLRQWMHLQLCDKPSADFMYTSSNVGFLVWLLRELGDSVYKTIKATYPEEAAELRRQILVICFEQANRLNRLTQPFPVALMALPMAEHALMFPEQVLGAEDARF